MEYELIKNVRKNQIIRDSFIKLACDAFGLPLRSWYEDGYWSDKYIPYVYTYCKEVIANASVNIIITDWQGEKKHFIQIGTVTTHPDFRNQGLAKSLIERIINDYSDHCDGIYLYANNTVLEFYPRLGFEEAKEYEWSIDLKPWHCNWGWESWKKLLTSSENSKNLLYGIYKEANPFSNVSMLKNYELLMFYCTNFMKECVYYAKEYNLICIAEQVENTVFLYDVYGQATCDLLQLIATLPFQKYNKVTLGFMPKDTKDFYSTQINAKDSTLFVLSQKENLFKTKPIRMPELSHA